jgi:hypothetical protein
MSDSMDLTRDELIEHVEELQARCEQLIRILRHLLPDRSEMFFICGEAGQQDEDGLPEAIQVCPTYGADWSALYRREGPQSGRVAVEQNGDGSLTPDASPSPSGGNRTTGSGGEEP